jgi:Transposase DDE domain group 1
VAHAGARLLAEVADGLGLTAKLSQRPAARRRRASAHDPGQMLRDVAVMIADGGDCLSDLAVLRDQPELFGRLPHDVTVWRLLDNVAADEFGADAIRAARAFSRKQAWERAGNLSLSDGMLIIDIDATEIGSHSDKQQAAGTHKAISGSTRCCPIWTSAMAPANH